MTAKDDKELAAMRMLERLYGEPLHDDPDAVVTRAGAHSIDGDGTDVAGGTGSIGDDSVDPDMASYRSLRSVFAEMKDDMAEPSAGGMAILLAAAAKHKPAKAASQVSSARAGEPGLWTRLKAGWAALAMHPGMMAAASLVLVGGTATAIYLRTGSVGDAPAVATNATAPSGGTTVLADEATAAAAAPTEPSPPPSPYQAPAAPGATRSINTEQAEVAAKRMGAGASSEPDTASGLEGKIAATPKPSNVRGVAAGKGAKDDAFEPNVGAESQDSGFAMQANDQAVAPLEGGGNTGARNVDSDRSAANADERLAKGPTAAPTATPATPATVATNKVQTKTSSQDSDAATLAQRAQAAAAAGNCATARGFGDQLKQLDPTAFAQATAASKALAACYVVAKPVSKSTTTVKKSLKAAPAKTTP